LGSKKYSSARDQLVARTRSIISRNAFAGETWFRVPARYNDRDGQVNAKDPVVPECPMNSGSRLGQKYRGNWKYMRPYP